MNDEILPWPGARAGRAAPRPQPARDGAQARPRRAARPPSASATPRGRRAALLQARGLVLLARNLASRHGEIDLACATARCWSSSRSAPAATRASAARQHRRGQAAAAGPGGRVLAAALAARHWRGVPPAARFDVVAFESGVARWLRDAFLVAG